MISAVFTKPLTVFGDPVDDKALAQINRVMEDERAVAGALMADHHLGYSMPIGGVVAYDGAVSPSGVGFDIACGNKCVLLGELASELDVRAMMHEIQTRIAFGLGRKNPEPVDHALFDNDLWREPVLADLKDKARAQLGTVGSGNHYVDLLEERGTGRLAVACHFGSRGLGHTIATRFLEIAYAGMGLKGAEHDVPAVYDVNTEGGSLYVECMNLAGEYAYAGRDFVIAQVLAILGADDSDVVLSVHNHHNFAWLEDGLWLVRKGATPLTRQPAFIGGSMGDPSVIVAGRPPDFPDVDHAHRVADIGAIGSAPHGAGRVMSRTKAAGKYRKVSETRTRPDGTTYTFKRRERDASTAAVDWAAERAALLERGVYVLGAGADEAPPVYKQLADVLAQHRNIEVLHTLDPIGVVMAGDDTRDNDPYRD